MLTFRLMFPAEARVVRRATYTTEPPLALLREAVVEVLSRRRLIRYLVSAEMKKRGSDTLLGNVWWILDPLLQMLVYLVFITIISRRSTPDYPLFIFAAILPYKWFTAAVVDATQSVVRQDKLIRQIAFPKIVLPIATATAEVVGFAWGMVPLFGIMLFYSDRITLYLLWIPVIALVQYAFSVACAVFVSAANVFFRDLGNVVGHLIRLWWFLSPGLYSLQNLEQISIFKRYVILHDLAAINPLAILFEAYRAVIYGTPDGAGPPHNPDLLSLAALLVVSLGLFGLAAIFFKRVEPTFAKVL